jgi:hypothetical protein
MWLIEWSNSLISDIQRALSHTHTHKRDNNIQKLGGVVVIGWDSCLFFETNRNSCLVKYIPIIDVVPWPFQHMSVE